MTDAPETCMFGLNFNSVTLEEAAEHLSNLLRDRLPVLAFTPNVDHIVLLNSNPEFEEAYKNAGFICADGMPLVWFSALIGKKLPERVTGVDLVSSLVSKASEKGLKIYFMGGKAEVTPIAVAKLQSAFPDFVLAGISTPPPGFENSAEENAVLVNTINQSSPDILFVALGAPKQEIWSYRHREKLNVGVIVAVGGAFDFLAGRIQRAPEFVQRLGLEWLWRLIHEPTRLWKRYLVRDRAFLGIAWHEWKKIRLKNK